MRHSLAFAFLAMSVTRLVHKVMSSLSNWHPPCKTPEFFGLNTSKLVALVVWLFSCQLLLASCLAMVQSKTSLARRRTLAKDRLVTQAISNYIKKHRDSLLQELPQRLQCNKVIRRNELCRLGRRKFRQEPQEVQKEFLSQVQTAEIDMADPGEPGLSGGQVVETDMHTEVTSAIVQSEAKPMQEGDSWDFDEEDLEKALSGDAATKADSVTQMADSNPSVDPLVESLTEVWAHQPARDAPLRHVLAKHISWLCKKFGFPAGAEVVASASRFSAGADKMDGNSSEKVLCAAVTGLAVKATITECSTEDLKQVWRHIGGKTKLRNIKKAEVKVLQAWAQTGLPGDFVTDSVM